MTTPFATKEEAATAATTRTLAGPVWVPPALAKIEGVSRGGWYVGFPPAVSKTILGKEDF